ncbi:MAG: efflux RND transporter permease subunit, partial [Bacteroides sp.]
VLLNPEKMKFYGIGLNEVNAALLRMNQNAAGGVLYEYGNEYIIRGVLSTEKLPALSKAVIKTVDDVPILVENIAEVKIGNRAPKMGIASTRTKPAVLLTITKQPNTSTLELTKKLD